MSDAEEDQGHKPSELRVTYEAEKANPSASNSALNNLSAFILS